MSNRKRNIGSDGGVMAREPKRAKADRHRSEELVPASARNPTEYTVGWICAILTEYVAAKAFLDENRGEPDYVPPNDNNHYTLGRVGKHNVVVAVLPDGEYGTSSAASVATDMLRSFPNIRIGLMVGVGGGAPSLKHDIRLGDIVVSVASGDGKAAVLQYDFGKKLQDQELQPTRHLDNPPTLLRTAITGLKAQYEMEGHQIEQAIQDVLEKNTKLQRKYKRPDQSSDRLYLPKITHHPEDESDCATVCGDNPSVLVPRDKRADHEENPAIHYGRIASANQLVKDATFRDRLAAKEDILCFEMEAAGLMNHFPCLIIRGVCDYSDSHKNKEWQGYAAMAAAAYARDLLYKIAPNKVEVEKKILDILPAVEGRVNEIYTNVQGVGDNVKHLRSQQRQIELYRWLSPPDPSVNYDKALQQRHKATGGWFLGGDTFKEWKTRQSSFLWLYGIAGCGKTILSSAIIEDLSPYRPLYFFFDFIDGDKQTFEKMIRTLIDQLCNRQGDFSQLDRLYSSCNDGRQQPTCQSLCETFVRMVGSVGEIWLVLDALDECSKEERKKLLSWIEGLLMNSEHGNVHLLATSRQERDIESEVLKFTHTDYMVPIQSGLVTDDLRAYVHSRVREGDGLKRWRSRPEIQNEIETVLGGNANGIWAACQLDVLENCLDYFQVCKALNSLPKTLDETYERILRKIPEEHEQPAIRILQFLTYSERPLRIEEAVDMIAVDIDTEGDSYFDPKYRMPDHSEILCYCSSLVVAVTKKGNSNDTNNKTTDLQLAHFSVKEYLTSDRAIDYIAQHFREVQAKASMAKVCLAYLLHLDVDLPTKPLTETFPFVLYCARYWIRFAAVAENENQTLRDFIKRFFDTKRCLYRNCYNLYSPDGHWKSGEWTREKRVSALYYASFGGLTNTVNYLLSQGADVNARDGKYGNALQGASSEGHEKTVELLLGEGADVNAQGGEYGNALQAASSRGHEKTVELLLGKGAEVNAQGGSYGNALQAASFGGHEKTVKLLLGKGAEVNAQGGFYGNALQAASSRGHDKTVELLLREGADVNAQGGEYGNALQAASSRGHDKTVELLLREGADVNAQGRISLNWIDK
ncbi:hypothetical protein AOL_s00006g591 [Orbilia oligospora ATCC 24927]|uniref:Uncharacterized protein n=1 Tax=Arthrobotrys oligospora (strain ATCC 24927 / CBS 115.81 / DSM 1491) TaxID=756982 RepID=G1X140_ARTOA|nr:hypothetical protein AOL_s00006g591 [Orbilia oligospora ATCC 24927]EGX53213.1 hypothetical protein AOL_s00006g591 [Orbilia oligospora ATCC 24927]